MVPTAPPPLAAAVPGVFRVSVLPEAVVRVVGVGGVVAAGRGAGRDAAGFGVVVRIGVGAGVSAAGVAGTSLSCGWTELSRLASSRSRFSAVSRASDVSLLLSETVHALNDSAATSANGAPRRRMYFDMRGPPNEGCSSSPSDWEAAVVQRLDLLDKSRERGKPHASRVRLATPRSLLSAVSEDPLRWT